MYSLVLTGQDCKNELSGHVLDFHDRSPLAGATILLTGRQQATVSDPDGRYSLDGLCEGPYELEISHPECRTLFLTVHVDGTTQKNILLEHHLEELQEVEVTGDAILKKTSSAQETSLDSDALEAYSSGSLGDALKELGGVSSLNTGSNIVKPTIHGLSGSRVLILNEGVRMQDMEWGEEHAPNIDINTAGQISVVKGASALQYGGDAIGGAVVIEKARIPSRDTLFGKTAIDLISNGRGSAVSSEMTRASKAGWYARGQASVKKIGDREAPDYVLSNTGIEALGLAFNGGRKQFEKGWDLNYSYYHSEIAILRASHIGNIDDLIRSINSEQPAARAPFTYAIESPRQEVTHHLGKLSYYRRFQGLGRWNLQYDIQNNRRLEYDIRVGADRNKPSIDLELTTHTLATDFKWDANRLHQLHAGVIGRYQNNFANPDTGVRRLIPDYQKLDFGAFMTGEFQAAEGIILEAGLRYDFNRIDAKKFYQTSRWQERGYEQDFQQFVLEDLGTQLLTNPVFDYHAVSATAGLLVSRNNTSEFKANYALSQRAPNPSELFSDGLHHSAARLELGDLHINKETSHKLAFSLTGNRQKWGYSLEPYANYIKNFILLEPSGVEFTLRGAFPVWNYRQTNARLYGFDASAYIHWTSNWESTIDFSMVKGIDRENKEALINLPGPVVRNRLLFREAAWNNLEIGLESTYVWRQNETPPNIEVFSPSEQQAVVLAINTPPAAYHLLGLRSSLKFPLSGALRLTTGLTISNVLDVTYREYLNRQRFFADELGRNIILQLKLNY